MRVTQLEVEGACVIDVEAHSDERGLFARTFCSEEFEVHGLPAHYPQSSTSFNSVRGTLRGMHLQISPSKESKLVRCTRGAVYDVVLDLRVGSATFGRSVGIELTSDNRRAVAIPPGCAHGFITLVDASEVLYMMSETHRPELARGVRWDDPAFNVVWPCAPVVIARRDANYPNFTNDLLKV